MNKKMTIESHIQATPGKVWEFWNEPRHIMQWLHASEDWECTSSENDLRVGGRLVSHMGAKDKSVGFDFAATYTDVQEPTHLAYTLDDGRTVDVSFTPQEDGVHLVQTFEMERQNSEEMQRSGWQVILDNFKRYVENQS